MPNFRTIITWFQSGRWKHLPFLIGAGLTVLVIALVIYRTHGKNGAEEIPSVPVSVAPVVRKNVEMTVREAGNVLAYETVAVRSRLDTQIMEVHFRDGDKVGQGDLLFVLDDRTLKAQLVQMEANLRRDQAQLDNLQRQFERSNNLAAKGFTPKATLDDSRAAMEVQRANVGATEAALESIKVQLQYTRIIAPITGRTGTINVTIGNTVKANDPVPLVTINQTQPIRVQLTLSQDYFNPLREAMMEGDVAVTAMREDDKPIAEGTLEYIDNMVNQSSGTFVTRAVFPNQDELLWPGMFVTAIIKLGEEKDVLTIPEVAIQHGQAEDYAFVVNGDKAERRVVKISRIQHGTAVVTTGLKDGERVAVDGLMSLKDGSVVTIKNAGEK